MRPLTPADLGWAENLVSEFFGSPRIASRGVLHHVRDLPGFISQQGSRRVGLVQYKLQPDQCEVVVVISLVKRQGIGRGLIKAVMDLASQQECSRIWLVTTNNNQAALDFYRALGWKQVAIHRGALKISRKLKPEIPENDQDGTPIEDEIELEYCLEGTAFPGTSGRSQEASPGQGWKEI